MTGHIASTEYKTHTIPVTNPVKVIACVKLIAINYSMFKDLIATNPVETTQIHGSSTKKYSIQAEWLYQSGHAPSEPSPTPRWRTSPHPASMQ
jgi:hypothetical protein